MNINNNNPLLNLIEDLSEEKGTDITFDDLKKELTKENDKGEKVYSLSLKEDDDLCMISHVGTKDGILERFCRSMVIEKKTLRQIASQGNGLLYNHETVEFLNDKKWSQVTIQKCYEGTQLVVFYHKNKWYISTRRCLDAQESTWVSGNSYYDMFQEAMKGVFTFDELNKHHCYHFVLIHSKNKNIVSYSWLGKDYAELLHVMTTEKYTLDEVSDEINEKVRFVEEEQTNFSSLEELQKELTRQNDLDIKYQKITNEGYILRYYFGEVHNSPFVNMKLQTEIYEKIAKMKPNNSNINQCFLELYQKDKLGEFLPFFTRYGGEVVKRINNSLKNISKEILEIYHATRNKKNEELYSLLTGVYKKCVYEIHGLYIKNRKGDFNNDNDNNSNNNNELPVNRAINVYDVYNYLKGLQANDLRQIYYDRMSLIDNPKMSCLNKNCIYTMTQCAIMFNNKNKQESK